MPTTPATPAWLRATTICLQLVVAVQCLALASWQWRLDGPVFEWIWHDGAALVGVAAEHPVDLLDQHPGGVPEVDPAEQLGQTVETVAAVLLIAAAILTLWRPLVWVLVPVALWQVAWSMADWTGGGSQFSLLVFFSHSARFLAPTALALLPRRVDSLATEQRAADAVNLLRYAAAATFIAHGIEALELHPLFLDYLYAASNKLGSGDLSPASAERLLIGIGVLDLVVAHLLLLQRWTWVALWMAFWGWLTAGSRVVFGGSPAYHEMLVRVANGGVPLALALAWWLSWRAQILSAAPAASSTTNEGTTQS